MLHSWQYAWHDFDFLAEGRRTFHRAAKTAQSLRAE